MTIKAWWRKLWLERPNLQARWWAEEVHQFYAGDSARIMVEIRGDLVAQFKAESAARGDYAPYVISRAVENYLAEGIDQDGRAAHE